MHNTQSTQLLFELSKPGRRAVWMPKSDVPESPLDELLPPESIAAAPPPLPELAEPDIVRHFLNLSTKNMSVDTHFYPLGSCTMKYNPKRNERAANLQGIADLHPYQPEETLQGMLELLYSMQQILSEIAGLDAASLQPAAGAHGEFTALMVAAAYFRDRGERRTKVLTPDSSHGTNPASAAMAGFETVTVRSDASGCVDLADLRAKLNRQTAVFMITNPNTLGLFDRQVRIIADEVHEHGGLIYLDGANMNAILGITRPGDFGADLMHFNPHKTFSGPHGGGGPGARANLRSSDARAVSAVALGREDRRFWRRSSLRQRRSRGRRDSLQARLRPAQIDRPSAQLMGNVGVLVRAYCYIRTYGPEGLRAVSENAVLSANYLLSQVKGIFPVPHGDRCLHEFVATASKLKAERGVSAMDLAKRLLDYGFHAPTVYFPLTVRESMMIEPTETESKETLDAFAATLARIVEESPELLREAPHTTKISRPDEVAAARNPILRWTPKSAGAAPA